MPRPRDTDIKPSAAPFCRFEGIRVWTPVKSAPEDSRAPSSALKSSCTASQFHLICTFSYTVWALDEKRGAQKRSRKCGSQMELPSFDAPIVITIGHAGTLRERRQAASFPAKCNVPVCRPGLACRSQSRSAIVSEPTGGSTSGNKIQTHCHLLLPSDRPSEGQGCIRGRESGKIGAEHVKYLSPALGFQNILSYFLHRRRQSRPSGCNLLLNCPHSA